MTLRVEGDGAALEKMAADNTAMFQKVVDLAKSHGVTWHRFYASDNEILVVDEWPDQESFTRFYEASKSDIGTFMGSAGVTTEPTITCWRELDTHDAVG
ncbi:MAG: hypothetical protein ACRDP1_03195 [Nocardioidaceae bacterium]